MSAVTPFSNELSAATWRRKYRYAGADGATPEAAPADSWRRVADAVASVEPRSGAAWRRRFRELLEGFRFLPAGRILASAGTDYDATLFNCFVMAAIDDSIEGIFERLKESALTMQRGGGIGIDFSALRPRGVQAVASGRTASGAVSFMQLWDSMCATLLSTGTRRGAMMGTLRCDHPDIAEFIEAKHGSGALTNFNLSVQVTDDFVAAVDAGADWPLVFPATGNGPAEVHSSVSARDLWRCIADAAYDSAEPGVLFVDRINAWNNLHYRETITTTNPCGEVPLPPNGACNLGSVNLAALVEHPFSTRARLDLDAIGAIARQAVRFLDDVIDLSRFPLEAQAAEARATRRIGLGITGLGDALIMLGLDYASDAGRGLAERVMRHIRDAAYAASIELAEEKGPFPAFEAEPYLDGRYIGTLPAALRDRIARHGVRNSHLLSIAPAGSISVLANNVSSGIEPVYATTMRRAVIGGDGARSLYDIDDFAFGLWQGERERSKTLPPAFVTANELAPEAHLRMAGILQPLVDNAISKTVNAAEDIARDEFAAIYRRAFELGLKGCTVYRTGSIGEGVLSAVAPESTHCCVPEREGD